MLCMLMMGAFDNRGLGAWCKLQTQVAHVPVQSPRSCLCVVVHEHTMGSVPFATDSALDTHWHNGWGVHCSCTGGSK